MKLLTGRLPISHLSQCTKISKLLVFQFKLLHRRLATNNFLKKINLKDNDLCSFCQIEEETLIHLFWNCTVTSCFWHDLTQWLQNNEISLRSLELTSSLAIGIKLHAHFTSIHPTRRKKRFLKLGKALSLLRTNSSETTLEENLSNFKSPLRARLYPKNVIQTTLSEASFADRQCAQTEKSPQRNPAFCLTIPTISAF